MILLKKFLQYYGVIPESHAYVIRTINSYIRISFITHIYMERNIILKENPNKTYTKYINITKRRSFTSFRNGKFRCSINHDNVTWWNYGDKLYKSLFQRTLTDEEIQRISCCYKLYFYCEYYP